jgi:hypothetical protein
MQDEILFGHGGGRTERDGFGRECSGVHPQQLEAGSLFRRF